MLTQSTAEADVPTIVNGLTADGKTMFARGDENTLVQYNTDFQTAQSLRNQMESLRIGGEIPPGAMGSVLANPPPYHAQQQQGLNVLVSNAQQMQVTEYPYGAVGAEGTDSSFDANSNILDTQSEYENRFHRAMAEGDYDFLRELSLDELLRRKQNLEAEMDEELKELQRRYQTKRQPILDVIATKKEGAPQL